MKKKQNAVMSAISHTVLLATLTVAGAANAALIARGTDMAYDDVLDITWLTNANALGSGTWDQMNTAAADYSLDYNGTTYGDWRLASMSVDELPGDNTTTSVVNCSSESEVACRDNELGYMFYHNLGGAFRTNLKGDQTFGVGADAVTLTDIQSLVWSGTEFGSFGAWYFSFGGGLQGGDYRSVNSLSGWAVRSGDVGAVAVPEPSTVLLLAGSLLGLIARRRR